MLERIAAFKELVGSQNPTAPIRKAITDAEAVELISELASQGGIGAGPAPGLQHAEKAVAAAARMAEILAEPIPSEPDALQAWAERKGRESAALWDALQGSVIDGVEIIRKRVS